MAYIHISLLFLANYLLLLQVAVVRAKVPAIIVFGDSSVDAGNNNQISTIAKSNFAPYGRNFPGGKPTGRFSNGRIPTDFLSEAFGLKPIVPAYLDPMFSIKDFATGVSFASAGSGYDNATSDVLTVIPLWKELEYYKDYQNELRAYLGVKKAKEVLSEALYVMSLGTNDFLENYYVLPNRSSQFTVKQYEDFLIGIAGNFVRQIYGLGARKISVGGLPPMGCMPLERTTNYRNNGGCVEEYNNVALDFNFKLKVLVMKLNKELLGAKIVLSNPYYILKSMVERPLVYGFENAAVACCSTGMFEMGYTCNRLNPFTCSDADKYVFWDAFHPTQRTNFILAYQILKQFLAQFL